MTMGDAPPGAAQIHVLWALAERGRLQGLRRLLFLAAIVAVALAMPAAALGAQTVVSITFDDGWDSESIAPSELTAHGMSGTFYVNSPRIDQPGYFSTWAQLTVFNAAGHEVAGHTLTHSDLTTLTATQAQREICDDRTNILSHGFVVIRFRLSLRLVRCDHNQHRRNAGRCTNRPGLRLRLGQRRIRSSQHHCDERHSPVQNHDSAAESLQDSDAVLHRLRVIRQLHPDGRSSRKLRTACRELGRRMGDPCLPPLVRQLRRRSWRAVDEPA